jgi:S-formylglutathione hydrolase FrmB
VCGCGSSKPELAAPPKVTNFALQSRLMGQPLYEVLVSPAGGGEGRPLLVFLHGYGAAPSDTLSPAFVMALRRLGDRAPVVLLPAGGTGWWHDRDEGPWGSNVLREAIPAALRRSGADRDRVAIGGISMGGFGAYDIALKNPGRFCAVGGHSPALWFDGSETAPGAFDDAADFEHNDVVRTVQEDPEAFGDAKVWNDYGETDDFRPYDEGFVAAMEAGDANFTTHSWPGGHEGSYWDAHWPAYQRFYVNALNHCG